ncbi:acetate--CoA ligase family protein [Marivirga salinae]|uniref:Acetate--CoA ligase family protein n=1 Tax=Marivirga salinarum TaxID=3059078 RepID=A0AA51N8Z4_9BACT|nr:acetate--CoA ligase family protein [Marivirga sp. BDSF4-3]WMN11002.1 acetate--CoA ligase family protein [Marivirga sp. BDSF4-3]
MIFKKKQFELLFYPKQIAIIGASTKVNKVGYALLKNILDADYKGEVFPVNINAKQILGVKTYQNIKEINHSIDLAIIAVAAPIVPEILTDCQKKGIKAIIIISAGFKETGLISGKILEQQISNFISEHDLLVVGPNCLGIINTDPKTSLNATFARAIPPRGNIAFISQSGAIGIHALEFADKHDIGFSKFVTIGNKSALDENDFIDYLYNDIQTKVILIYLENFADGIRFREIVKRNNKINRKPIILLKSGRSESGKKAALSHTGSLAGEDGMISYFLEDCSVIRVNTMEEMFHSAMIMANQPVPKGDKLLVVTNAGGQGIMAMDSAEKYHLKVAELLEEEQHLLKTLLPPPASVKNPIDILGDATADRYRDTLRDLIKLNSFDLLLVICTPQFMTKREEILKSLKSILEKARKRNIPIAAVFPNVQDDAVMKLFDEYDLPNYEFPEQAVKALSYYSNFGKYSQTEELNPSKKLAERKYLTIKKQIDELKKAGERYFNEIQSYSLLKEFGFEIAPYAVSTNLKEALQTSKIKYPMVAKILAKGVIHKYDIGGVIVNISNKNDLIEAFSKISTCVSADRFQAVVLQSMVKNGVELIMGIKYHEGFGHAIMFGMGGTKVEILQDVIFGMAPLSKTKALQMINSIKGVKLLEGYRSQPPVNKEGLANLLLKLSYIVYNFPEISSLDLNPVFASETELLVADARIFIK